MSYTSASSLSGKVVIVTGAGRGVGRGIARALAANGAALLLTDILEEDLEVSASQVKALGADVDSVAADLADITSPNLIIERAVQRFGRLDALVNVAIAIKPGSPFTEQSAADFDRAIATGPRATFLLMQQAFPHLAAAGGGSIVNFGSGAGAAGQEGFGAYAAAKEAIRGLSRVAALEWGPANIRVNVVLPFANSEGAQQWEQVDPDAYKAALQSIPLKRIGDVQSDTGALVSFLIGDDATYLTAQSLYSSGGSGVYR